MDYGISYLRPLVFVLFDHGLIFQIKCYERKKIAAKNSFVSFKDVSLFERE